ncbi:hypothetical protein DPMN_164150 [Dreissena polymorpha]|uniref:Uncharacterized protein n=1 Tax=Dreissena polymorpha TaxID=45954 RepID=A0A9D4IV47_DREPO|nr:hypothetical protein DPMN_164150 [Dreissena polymorpha]
MYIGTDEYTEEEPVQTSKQNIFCCSDAANFVWYMAFVKDILNEIAKISLSFQRDDITVYSAGTKLQSAEGTQRNLMDNDGASVVEIQAEIVKLMVSFMAILFKT